MEACVETLAMPVVDCSPAWAIRVSRPRGDGFRTAEHLQGVPKPVLQTVFGKALGRRIWEQARSTSAKSASSPAEQVADEQISLGMADYLSRQAATTLQEKGRVATTLRITMAYADGQTRVAHAPLARPTNDGDEISATAQQLLRRFSAHGLQSVSLTVASVEVAATEERTPALVHSMANA